MQLLHGGSTYQCSVAASPRRLQPSPSCCTHTYNNNVHAWRYTGTQARTHPAGPNQTHTPLVPSCDLVRPTRPHSCLPHGPAHTNLCQITAHAAALLPALGPHQAPRKLKNRPFRNACRRMNTWMSPVGSTWVTWPHTCWRTRTHAQIQGRHASVQNTLRILWRTHTSTIPSFDLVRPTGPTPVHTYLWSGGSCGGTGVQACRLGTTSCSECAHLQADLQGGVPLEEGH